MYSNALRTKMVLKWLHVTIYFTVNTSSPVDTHIAVIFVITPFIIFPSTFVSTLLHNLEGVSLPLKSSPNKFSRYVIFTDGHNMPRPLTLFVLEIRSSWMMFRHQ